MTAEKPEVESATFVHADPVVVSESKIYEKSSVPDTTLSGITIPAESMSEGQAPLVSGSAGRAPSVRVDGGTGTSEIAHSLDGLAPWTTKQTTEDEVCDFLRQHKDDTASVKNIVDRFAPYLDAVRLSQMVRARAGLFTETAGRVRLHDPHKKEAMKLLAREFVRKPLTCKKIKPEEACEVVWCAAHFAKQTYPNQLVSVFKTISRQVLRKTGPVHRGKYPANFPLVFACLVDRLVMMERRSGDPPKFESALAPVIFSLIFQRWVLGVVPGSHFLSNLLFTWDRLGYFGRDHLEKPRKSLWLLLAYARSDGVPDPEKEEGSGWYKVVRREPGAEAGCEAIYPKDFIVPALPGEKKDEKIDILSPQQLREGVTPLATKDDKEPKGGDARVLEQASMKEPLPKGEEHVAADPQKTKVEGVVSVPILKAEKDEAAKIAVSAMTRSPTVVTEGPRSFNEEAGSASASAAIAIDPAKASVNVAAVEPSETGTTASLACRTVSPTEGEAMVVASPEYGSPSPMYAEDSECSKTLAEAESYSEVKYGSTGSTEAAMAVPACSPIAATEAQAAVPVNSSSQMEAEAVESISSSTQAAALVDSCTVAAVVREHVSESPIAPTVKRPSEEGNSSLPALSPGAPAGVPPERSDGEPPSKRPRSAEENLPL